MNNVIEIVLWVLNCEIWGPLMLLMFRVLALAVLNGLNSVNELPSSLLILVK
jgi:hypothetical protein